MPLEGEIVHRHHRGLAVAAETQIGRRHRPLPVMGMDEIGLPALHEPAGDIRGYPAQHRETKPVVRVIGAGRIAIGPAGPVVERRRVDDQEIEPLHPRRQQA